MKRTSLALAVLLCLVAAGCKTQGTDGNTTDDVLPAEPDYADETQWYIDDKGAQADIFYIISTETGDYPLADGTICHYADTYADSLRLPLRGEMVGVDTLVSDKLNFFAPYYRQCSLQSFENDSTGQARMQVATADVRKAFDHYLQHQNGGRPFILAGFSQGAAILLSLLRGMDDATRSRMIAAYAIGISIPEQASAGDKHFKAAQGADDTGVIVSYNSVRDTTCALWPNSTVGINPVNWRTDGQPATLITEPSPLLPVGEQTKDTMTVSLDTATNLLIVSGYSATDYILPLIGKEGNYHSREIWLYRDQLRENMALRAERFLQSSK